MRTAKYKDGPRSVTVEFEIGGTGRVFADDVFSGTFLHPYKEADLPRVSCATMNGVLVIVHKDYAPRMIERLGDGYTFQQVRFDK